MEPSNHKHKCQMCNHIFEVNTFTTAIVYCEICGGYTTRLTPVEGDVSSNGTIRAAVLEELGKPLVIKELAIPKLDFGQVLVKIYASGICGAQIGEISGANGEDKYLPHLLGHEGGGIVAKIGPGVTQIKIGDHVVMHWRKGPGMQSNPPKYIDEDGNSVGAGWVTTFSDYAVVSENRLTTIGDNIPFEIAALMGCAVTTGLGLINNEANLKIGQSIAVAGCGGVGLNVIQGAAMVGGYPIIAMDIYESKLHMARDFGATKIVDLRVFNEPSLLQEVFEDVGPVDIFVDCTGDVGVIEKGYSIARKTVLVGQPSHFHCLKIPSMRKNYCGKIMLDSQGGLTHPAIDIPKYLRLYQAGMLELETLITHRYPLDEINEAVEVIHYGQAGRCILEMNR